MKQVLFIAGTAYSGSSMLDMMLGNAESSLSLGEVKFLFEPLKIYHINPQCDCGDSSCKILQKLKISGKKDFYSKLFNEFRHINSIVDSSKDLFWISEQRNHLLRLGIQSKVILIWKSPEEYALSRYKRNEISGWQRDWVNYHRLFFSLNEIWYSVAYRELATNPSGTLERLCSALAIPYVKNMEHYWNKKHHMLFGNHSAKYHTLNKEDEKFNKIVNNLNKIEAKVGEKTYKANKKYRQILYDSDSNKKLPQSVIKNFNNPLFLAIISVLKIRKINKNVSNMLDKRIKHLSLCRILIKFYNIKRTFKSNLFYLHNRKKMN